MTARGASKPASPPDEGLGPAETPEVLIGIGALTVRLGATVRAVRHYERLGLIRPLRDEKERRVYGREEWARLELIVQLRSADIGLAKIREALDDAGKTPARVAALLDAQASRLEAQLRHVRTLRQRLFAGQDA
jgi:DNA-binding transcriptional MerR regulator